MNKIIVNFTPTGLIPQKSQTPHVPIHCNEIIGEVEDAYRLGISMVHLHIRDPQTEQPSYKKELYAKIIEGIRSSTPELIICVSTSGRLFIDYEQRAQVLSLEDTLKPDMASLTLSSLNFNHHGTINEPATIIRLAKEMLDRGIKPELEIFDTGMVNYANYLIKKEILKPPYYFNIILGNIACAQPDLIHIGSIIKDLPPSSFFSLGGVGRFQLQTNSLAISMGYGVRVGLEDNIWFDQERSKLATNIQLIKRVRDIVDANEKEFMAPSELRTHLKLKKGYGEYGAE